MAAVLANAATRSAIEGSSFGSDVAAAIPDVVAQTIYDAIDKGVSFPKQQVDADPVATGGAAIGGAAASASGWTIPAKRSLTDMQFPLFEPWKPQVLHYAGEGLVNSAMDFGRSAIDWGSGVLSDFEGVFDNTASQGAEIVVTAARNAGDWLSEAASSIDNRALVASVRASAAELYENAKTQVGRQFIGALAGAFVPGSGPVASRIVPVPIAHASGQALADTVTGTIASAAALAQVIDPNNLQAKMNFARGGYGLATDPGRPFRAIGAEMNYVSSLRGMDQAAAYAYLGTRVISEGTLLATGGEVADIGKGFAAEGIPTQLELNKAAGAAFQSRVDAFGADTLDNFAREVSIRPNTATGPADFKFRIDVLGNNPDTQALEFLEAKASETAPLTVNQAKGFPLVEQYGGSIVGRMGGAANPAGTSVPSGTGVRILRPSNLPPGY